MKRYGFKFEKMDGYGAKFIELRFSITIFSMFALVFTQHTGGRGDGAYYVFYWFFYMIFAFLPEIFKRIHVYLVIALSLISCVVVLVVSTPYSVEAKYERNIFIIYQLSVLFVGNLYLYAKFRKTKR